MSSSSSSSRSHHFSHYRMKPCCSEVPRTSHLRMMSRHWSTIRFLARGSNGEVSLVHDNCGTTAVVKEESGIHDTLTTEKNVYQALDGAHGFPTFFDYRVTERKRQLYIQRLGGDLSSVRQLCGSKMSLGDALRIGIQLVKRLRTLHATGYVHGTLHPGNVMFGQMGTLEDKTVFLIDFGDASPFLLRNGMHVGESNVPHVVGTLDFGSPSMLQRRTQSRRDDMQSVLYLLIHLHFGQLPWSNYIQERSSSRRSGKPQSAAAEFAAELASYKTSILAHEITHGFPEAMCTFAWYVINLQFAEEPRYDVYLDLLRASLKEADNNGERSFDWYRKVFDEKNPGMKHCQCPSWSRSQRS